MGKEDDERTNVDGDSVDSNYNDDRAIIAPVLKRGDALIYDYRVCHRGTANLFGKLDDITKLPTTHSRKKHDDNQANESDIRGTRRILYLMYARPWFTDHVNFDYTKNAKSLWNDNETIGDYLSKNI